MTWRSRLRSESGFSFLEIVMVVAIMGIVYGVLGATYDSLKARMRFSHIRGDMDAIAKAAFADFAAHPNNEWAAMVMPGDPPSFVGKNLNRWPTPPCPGWYYSWDNFYGVPSVQAVRITVRRHDLSAIWNLCLQNYEGNCNGDDGFGGTPPAIDLIDSKYVSCGE